MFFSDCQDIHQSAAGILPADLTLPESGAMPKGFCNFRAADRIIIQFDLPAGCRKHFVDRPHPGPMIGTTRHKSKILAAHRYIFSVNVLSRDHAVKPNLNHGWTQMGTDAETFRIK
jgi:hypothetical protein